MPRKAAIKARRPDLPVGLSLAIVDDVAAPGGEELRDRKRAEVYEHWLELARDDDFVGVQNYERIVYGPDGQVAAPRAPTSTGWAPPSSPTRCAAPSSTRTR